MSGAAHRALGNLYDPENGADDTSSTRVVILQRLGALARGETANLSGPYLAACHVHR